MQRRSGHKLVKLANGVYSLHCLAYGETFHPVIGPAAEAEALYVRQVDLLGRLRAHPGEFVVWDVGLGAAANALTLLRAARGVPRGIRLLSFDQSTAPLQFALEHAKALGYLEGYEDRLQLLLNRGEASFTEGAQKVDWSLHQGDFPTLLASSPAGSWPKPHLILFDAFSPAKNPEMWTQSLFTRLHSLLDPDRPCVLPTYSRSTMLRVTLLVAGFHVGAGHATGEKEETTIAANTPALIKEPLGQNWLRRARHSTSAEPLSEPIYRQAPLRPGTLTKLLDHPQFHPS